MKKYILSIIMICSVLMLLSSISTSAAVAPDSFTDIQGHWAESAINEVIQKGLMQGMSVDDLGNRIFAPDEKVSRAQAAAVLVPAFHLDFGQVLFIRQPLASDYFDDVISDDWYAGALVVCAFNEVFPVQDRFFYPSRSITRLEMASAIQHCFLAKDIDVPMIMMMPVYDDTYSLTSEEQQTVAFISNTGIMKGSNALFRPHEPLSRAELAQILSSCSKAANRQVDVDENSDGMEYNTVVGQSFVLALPSNPSTGFKWDYSKPYDSSILLLLDSYYNPSNSNPQVVGGGGTDYWRFRALRAGTTEVSMVYSRPWESVQPLERFTIRVEVSEKDADRLIISSRIIKESSDAMVVDMQVPTINGGLPSGVKSVLNERWLKDAQDFKSSVASGLAEYLEESRTYGGEKNPFGSYSSYEIGSMAPGILSMYVDYYQYMGGAHGLTDRKAYNIDLSNGSDLALGDLFISGFDYRSIINQFIEDKISISSEFYFEGAFSGIKDDQEFYIKDDQLVIYFQQYEIAAYAAGIPEFSVPMSYLSDGIKPGILDILKNI